LVAFPAVVLNMPTNGTGKAEGCVAARAELRTFGALITAFGALHG
jgi:hypothetical protein